MCVLVLEQKKVDTEGFEPSASRMRNGRSSTELSAHVKEKYPLRDSNPQPLD